MKISLAEALGTCFGVRDAIEAALDESFRDNLTIIGQLVHNPRVLSELREHGISFVDSIDENIPTENVMITAHGAPASVKTKLQERGHVVYDAACPLVLRVHTAVQKLVREGYFPVVIGQREHVEVRGIVGDLDAYEIVNAPEDLDRLCGVARLGIVAQTTQQIEHVEDLVARIRARFPAAEVRFIDTVCKPTKERQTAVRSLAGSVDLMIVIGGKNSSNTRKLKRVCDDRGVEAHHISGPEELVVDWFRGREHIGITAGTSTPQSVIDEVHEAIRAIGAGLAAHPSSP